MSRICTRMPRICAIYALLTVLCIARCPFSCYSENMTITQTVEIPADRRVHLELPRSAPSGVMALVHIDIPAVSADGSTSPVQPLSGIEEIRQLLKKEMAAKGTLAATAASGGGWEAHVRERILRRF